MKSFNEYIDWKKETGYVKSSGGVGSGGKGGHTEHVKGYRVIIGWTDKKNKKWTTMIPPVQYKPAKNEKKAKEYAKDFIKDTMAKGGSIKKVEYEKE
jgi:hypothetical protein